MKTSQTKGRVLFADNMSAILDTMIEFVENEGYEVLPAETLEKAEEILLNSRVHLAILDVRLVDDADENDQSGLDLARDLRFQEIPKIILTYFPTFQNVRAALAPRAAVEFLAKTEEPQKLVDAVASAFREHVGINFDLDLDWKTPWVCSSSLFVSMMDPNVNNSFLSDRIGEFEDVLRKLFCKYEQVSINELFWTREQRVCFGVTAFAGGKEEQYIVICGENERIGKDTAGLDQYQAIRKKWISSRLSAACVHYSAFAWGMNATTLVARSFPVFFQIASEKQLRQAMENLLPNLLPDPNGVNLSTSEERTLRQERLVKIKQQVTQSGFIQRVKALASEARSRRIVDSLVCDAGKMVFRFSNGIKLELPNPVEYFTRAASRLDPDLPYGITFGGLEAGAVVIGQDGSNWVTDFSRLGPGPVLEDLVALELQAHFESMETDNLLTLSSFEDSLLSAENQGNSLSPADVEPECRRALAAIQMIRRQAVEAAGGSLLPYRILFLIQAVGGFYEYDPSKQHSKLEVARALHRLLACGLVFRELSQSRQVDPGRIPPEGERGIVIDESKHEVRLDGHLVKTTPTEWNILLYLYQHQGHLCKRTDILEAMGIKNPDPNAIRGTLDTNIDRIRRKFKETRKQPRYLRTVRGEGFILLTKPD